MSPGPSTRRAGRGRSAMSPSGSPAGPARGPDPGRPRRVWEGMSEPAMPFDNHAGPAIRELPTPEARSAGSTRVRSRACGSGRGLGGSDLLTWSCAKRSDQTRSAIGAQLAGSVSTLRCTPSSCAHERVRVQRGFGSGDDADLAALAADGARLPGPGVRLPALPAPGPGGTQGRGSVVAADATGEKGEVAVKVGEAVRLVATRQVEKIEGSIVICSACEAGAGWAENGVRRRRNVGRVLRSPKWRFQAGCWGALKAPVGSGDGGEKAVWDIGVVTVRLFCHFQVQAKPHGVGPLLSGVHGPFWMKAFDRAALSNGSIVYFVSDIVAAVVAVKPYTASIYFF